MRFAIDGTWAAYIRATLVLPPLPRQRLRLDRTLRLTLAWVVVGLIAAVFESNVLAQHGLPGELNALLWKRLWRGLVAGLLGGGFYLFVLRDGLRKHPYVRAVAIMLVLVFFVVFLVNVLVPAISANRLEPSYLAQRVFQLGFWAPFLFWGTLMAATMLMVRVNDQYGSGGIAYLTGRYYKPQQELRIFMFMDMRSSTAIAEELGHMRYFEMLNEVYADLTDPVMHSRGEIYQYVGDELSVSWPLRKGLKDHRCIRAYFAIRQKLESRAAHYQARYGFVPHFKTGLHYGEVTSGEVGLTKKELIFSGDVVNTAARIQHACAQFNVDLLVSKDLLDVLRLPEKLYHCRPISEIPLKGKRLAVSLWTIDLPVSSAQVDLAEKAQRMAN
jgi:adenylate cyclase